MMVGNQIVLLQIVKDLLVQVAAITEDVLRYQRILLEHAARIAALESTPHMGDYARALTEDMARMCDEIATPEPARVGVWAMWDCKCDKAQVWTADFLYCPNCNTARPPLPVDDVPGGGCRQR